MGDRVAVLDPPPDLSPQQIRAWRQDEAGYGLALRDAVLPVDQGVSNPSTGRNITVPPSGHIAGVWARSDGEARCPKAPRQ